MHIKISKASLSEALNNVQAVVGAKTALQILQNVKVEAQDGEVKFTCSDLDVTLVSKAECEVIDQGATTIPVKPFASAVGKMVDGTIEISVDANDCATISAGASVFKFKGMPAKEFPSIPAPDGASCTISSNALREMMRETAFAASQDDTRRTLKGVLLDFKEGEGIVRAVATDGRRLAMLDCELETTKDFVGQYIVPIKAVDMLSKKIPKEGNAELVTAKGQLLVKTARLILITKILDEAYPNYIRVVPTGDGHLMTINRAEFLGALDRISVFTAVAESPCVTLSIGDNSLSLNSGDTEYGTSHDMIPIKYSGETIDMRFNPHYVREVLMALDDEEIVMKIQSSSAPAVIMKSGSEDYTYVVMPLRA